MPDSPIRRHPLARVALETTLLLHGVPKSAALGLANELLQIVASRGAIGSLVGVMAGVARADLSIDDLRRLLDEATVAKLNTSSLGIALARGTHGATTVSSTMEIAAANGIRLFATGGLGGVHRDLSHRLDISADLMAFTRFPVAVVASGCKSILNVIDTREMLETLGVPVVGFRTDRFPAFYQRDGGAGVDARFDDVQSLARFVRDELARTSRGIVIANPIPAADEIPAAEFAGYLDRAEREAREQGAAGRDATPAVLGALHRISNGRTLAANIALVKNNADLAGQIAAQVASLA